MKVLPGRLLLAFIAFGLTLLSISSKRMRPPVAPNYRGKPLPVVLGIAFTAGVSGAILLGFFFDLIAHHHVGHGWAERITMLGGVLIVFVAGLYDDYVRYPARGLVGHLREAWHGRISPGVVKLIAAVVASVLVAAILRKSWWQFVLGVPVMAGAANLWNLLDVRPGRALKYFIPAASALVGASWGSAFAPLGLLAIAAALAVLVYDLRERAMLGDSGANALGFVVGVGLALTAPLWGLVTALVAILVLHLVAETVTLSRVIEVVRPLRWLDRLGRAENPSMEGGPGSSL